MLTHLEQLHARIDIQEQRAKHFESRLTALEEYNLTRDNPKPAGIREDLAALCKGFNADPKSLLAGDDRSFRRQRKTICIRLAQRGWTMAQVASLFNRDIRTIRRLCMKSTWDDSVPRGVKSEKRKSSRT